MDNDFNDFRRKLRDDFQDRPFNVGRGRPAAIAAYDPEFPTGGPFDDYYEERSVRPARDAREFSQMLNRHHLSRMVMLMIWFEYLLVR